MKKKLLSIALAAFLVVGMSSPAFAAGYSAGTKLTGDTATNNGAGGVEKSTEGSTDYATSNNVIPLKVDFEADTLDVTNVIAVCVDTTEVTFKYIGEKKKLIWDPQNLTYVNDTDPATVAGGWQNSITTKDITVTNYSDVDITVTGTIESTEVNGDVAFEVKGDNSAGTSDTLAIGTALDSGSAAGGNAAGTAKSKKFTVSVSGTPVKASNPQSKLTLKIEA